MMSRVPLQDLISIPEQTFTCDHDGRNHSFSGIIDYILLVL
jgi:hypothetical protein